MDRSREELSLDSGVLAGSAAEGWSAAPDEFRPSGAHCHEVEVAEWPAFCRWFTDTFRGIELSAQCIEGMTGTTEAINLPLEFIKAQLLENQVGAIIVAVKTGLRLRRLNITNAIHLRMYCNAAGWPTELEIVTSSGNVILRFSGGIEGLPQVSTCWGE